MLHEVQGHVIEALKNPTHRVFELHEVNPVLRVSECAGLVVRVAECRPTGGRVCRDR